MESTYFYVNRGDAVTAPKQKILHRIALALLLVGYFTIVYVVFAWLGIGCVFRDCLGFPCPGCGMSRAALALTRLDFAAAWGYHPLVFAMPYVFVYLFFDLKPAALHRGIMAAIGIAALVHWAYVLFQH